MRVKKALFCSLSLLVSVKFRFPLNLTNLNAVGGVVNIARLALGIAMFGVHAPGALGFLGFEFDNRTAFAVLCEETLVRDVSRHRGCKFDHAVDQCDVILAHVRHETRTKDGNDHGESP